MYKRTKIEAEVHPRFLCLEEFMNYTGLGRGSAMKLGKEIGCVMKVGNQSQAATLCYGGIKNTLQTKERRAIRWLHILI